MNTKKNNNRKKKQGSLKLRSYSPQINKRLIVHSLKTLQPKRIDLCNSLLKININNTENPKCIRYDNNKVIKLLLHNLKSSKHLNPLKFIPPKQLLSNCWFNTMFVTFFFSDKGRKFFRFFRTLMITGKKVNNMPIKNHELRKLFFVLNLFIEASYNQENNNNLTKKYNSKTKTIGLHAQLNTLTKNLNTNYFIYHIYQLISNPKKAINSNKLLQNDISPINLPNIKDAGNPLEYYETIFNYLNYNLLKLMKINLINKINLTKHLIYKFSLLEVIPDIIILEDFESNTVFETEYNFKKKERNYKYTLDSIILTNKDHFNPKANSHFVSVLTINKKQYKFDGSSYSRLTKFEWKNKINNNKDWTFKENPNYYPEKYNFTRGYKIMFYYRDK